MYSDSVCLLGEAKHWPVVHEPFLGYVPKNFGTKKIACQHSQSLPCVATLANTTLLACNIDAFLSLAALLWLGVVSLEPIFTILLRITKQDSAVLWRLKMPQLPPKPCKNLVFC